MNGYHFFSIFFGVWGCVGCFFFKSECLLAQKKVDSSASVKEHKELEEVVVLSQRSEFKLEGDKKVFEVSSSIAGQGGTAVDVIRNIPSLDVDINGNVILRGKSPRIFLDGKPSDLTLDQIPAAEIERIEIMTMPSAKYAANSSGGILNVVMKKKAKLGINGMVSAGFDRLLGWNVGGNLTYGVPKWELGLRYFAKNGKSATTQKDEREWKVGNAGNAKNVSYINNGEAKGNPLVGFVMPSVKYLIDPKTSLQASGRFFFGDMDFFAESNVKQDSFYANAHPKEQAFRNINTNATHVFFNGYTLEFDRRMKQKGSQWNAMLRYNASSSSRPTESNSTMVHPIGRGDTIRNDNQGKNRTIIASTDFTLQLRPTLKLEFGGQLQYRDIDFELKKYRNSVLDELTSTAYTNTEIIGGAYVTFTQDIQKFTYQVGLRMESSSFAAYLKKRDTTYHIDYPFLLFPSAALQYKLDSRKTLQLSYSYRVDRPNFFQTVPLVQYNNPLNIFQGNPNLKPSFIHLLELNYSWGFPQLRNSTLIFTLYYKSTTDLITTYYEQQTTPEGEKQIVSTPRNSGTLMNVGLEITPRLVLTSWYTLTPNINVLYNDIPLQNLGGETKTMAGWSAFFKLNQSIELPKKWKIQITAKYRTRSIAPPNSSSSQGRNFGPPQQNLTAQGYIGDVFEMDIGVQKNWGNHFFLSFNMNDVFGTNYRIQVVDATQNFYQRNSSLQNPFFASLNLRYIFYTYHPPKKIDPEKKQDPDDQQADENIF